MQELCIPADMDNDESHHVMVSGYGTLVLRDLDDVHQKMAVQMLSINTYN